VIIWINGAFGAGKTTLAEELHRRLPDAVVYDPEDVGLMVRKWVRADGDFQHLPSWRELVVATALSLRRHHRPTPRRPDVRGTPASAEPGTIAL
jgi:thymidylate kinase